MTLDPTHHAYVHALTRHDWHYEYSDDHAAWLRGNAERAALQQIQRQLDPDYTVWNAHAPEQYRRTIS